MQEVDIQKVRWTFENAARGLFIDPVRALMCVAYVMLKAKEKGMVDVADLPTFLEECCVPKPTRSLICMTIEKEWNRFRPLIASFSADALREFMACSYVDSRRFSSCTPYAIQGLLFKLLKIERCDAFADFGCDTGSVLINALREAGVKHAFGCEIAKESATIAQMRLEAAGLGRKSEVVLQDMFTIKDDTKFDKVFCCPPWGMKFTNDNIRDYVKGIAALPELKPSCSSTWIFVLKMLDSLRSHGKGIAIVNDGSLFNQAELTCRKYLIDRNLVETVVSLPTQTFSGTAVATSIVVFNPSKNDTSILMVDASQLGLKSKGSVTLTGDEIDGIVRSVAGDTKKVDVPCRRVDVADLERDEYILHPRRYIKSNTAEAQFDNCQPLEDIVLAIRRGSSLSSRELEKLTVSERTPYHFITQANIKDGVIEKGLPSLKKIPAEKLSYCAKDGDVVLTKTGRPIKSAVVRLEKGGQLLVGGNQYIISPDTTKVDPFYLKAFFDSTIGQSVLAQISVGAGMPAIALRDLNEVKIPIVPMEKQIAIRKSLQARQDEVELLKRKLDKSLAALGGIFEELAKED